MQADRHIDAIGKACPLPLVLLAKAVRELASGQTVLIAGNDPTFADSVTLFCQERALDVLETEREGRIVRMLIRV